MVLADAVLWFLVVAASSAAGYALVVSLRTRMTPTDWTRALEKTQQALTEELDAQRAAWRRTSTELESQLETMDHEWSRLEKKRRQFQNAANRAGGGDEPEPVDELTAARDKARAMNLPGV